MMTISRARLQAIEAIRDEEIDYSDIPATDEAFWSQATLHQPASQPGLYIPLDQDLLDWLQRSGPGYQTRIKAIFAFLHGIASILGALEMPGRDGRSPSI